MKKLILILFISASAQSQINLDSNKISDSAIQIIDSTIEYVPGWVDIPYPNGDVNPETGVCSDVVIRAFRKFGYDLQEKIHIDMTNNFESYPNYWGHSKPDNNIDHRRVYNQMRFFKRMGNEIEISNNPDDYLPGDVVSWNLGGNTTHIGIVVNKKSNDGIRNMIVHNIGSGQVLEDVLFNYDIIGHYRFNI
tara:strand:+ start:1922 stop:2497 length:576 start_codon:yes stop_codon:yes gene_type:complete